MCRTPGHLTAPPRDSSRRQSAELAPRHHFSVPLGLPSWPLIWRAAISRAEGREGRFSAGFYPTGRIGGIRYAAYTEAWQVVGRNADAWQTGRPHHVAFCWDGNRIWWIVDGQPGRSARQDLPFDFTVNEEMDLVLGAAASAGFVIWDLRISAIPRAPDAVGFHYPAGVPADFHTLLLDRLDVPPEPEGTGETRPVVMMPRSSQRGGRADPPGEFVETPFGIGLAL